MNNIPAQADVVVVGAGVAGLACARALAARGRRPVVIDRARGVGGRCATRRIEGQPVDHGLAFLHAADPEVVDDIRSIGNVTLLPGWPARVTGGGQPCQPRSLDRDVVRFAIAEGVSAWPKHLARGLDVRLRTRVVSLDLDPGGFRLEVETESGTSAGTDPDAGGGAAPAPGTAATPGTLRASEVVLALAGAQTIPLLAGLPQGASEDLRAARALLGMLGGHPCLTVIAGYPAGQEGPEWDICHPGDSRLLAMIAHDSAKRPQPRRTVLVFQALPCWSRQRQDDPERDWIGELLAEAARWCGDWAARPEWTQSHRWRYARTDPGSELSGPMLLDFGGPIRLGLAGEMFHPGAGAAAAWMSGVRLAARLSGERSS